MTITIIGAGMAGLLAANLLSRRNPIVYEAQAALPNNHSAVLRFRSSIVGDALGIPFKKVQMIKAPLPWRNPVADALAYSTKCFGIARSDRSILDGVVVAERYVAPENLIQRMAEGVNINYGSRALSRPPIDFPTISTIPMPSLMAILGYHDRPKFNYVPGLNISARIAKCDAYVSLLIADPAFSYSRISITGDELIIEVPRKCDQAIDECTSASTKLLSAELIVSSAIEHLGIAPERVSSIAWKEQTYAKIAPIDDDARKRFLHWATVNHNIFSLGRYATWRPKLLLDDLVNDIRKIERWAFSGSHYDVALAGR